MPRYDFKCQRCGEIREFMAGMGEIIIEASCPRCKRTVKFVRSFSPSKNFILKGKGWAKDNYCKKSESKKEKKDVD